ncbi:MAG: hypothetical protein R6X13_07810 [bacterium]
MHHLRVLFALALLAGLAPAQFQFGVVCTTDNPFATSPNSSHRLGATDELVGGATNTVHFVYSSHQAAWIRTGTFRGSLSWDAPVLIDADGVSPAIDCRPDGHRYVVWSRGDSIGHPRVCFQDLDTAMPPVLLTEVNDNSVTPDVYCDDSGRAHIVWQEEKYGADSTDIMYRSWYGGVLSSPVVISSEPGYEQNDCPSISCFEGGDIYVTWRAYDSALASPWSIKRRRLIGGQWQPVELVWHSARELKAPSLDFGRGGEPLGVCWADSTAGGFDPHYLGGNGGGYSTHWEAGSPVVSNLGNTWSYLFWQDDSGGDSDIRTHFYYFMTGWDAGYSIRQFFGITENIWSPTCLGALVLWLQGEPNNCRVMYAYFDYPIGIAESPRQKSSRRLSVQPNPVRAHARVTARGPVSVFDRSGRLVAGPFVIRNGLRPCGNSASFDIDLGSLPSGVYLVRSGAESATVVKQ